MTFTQFVVSDLHLRMNYNNRQFIAGRGLSERLTFASNDVDLDNSLILNLLRELLKLFERSGDVGLADEPVEVVLFTKTVRTLYDSPRTPLKLTRTQTQDCQSPLETRAAILSRYLAVFRRDREDIQNLDERLDEHVQ